MKKIAFGLLLFLIGNMSFAIEPFTITDIRVEGLQRLEEGTVFNYLPLKVGDEANDEEIFISVKELFATGFFKDVSLDRDGTTLVVRVIERPSIASIDISGNSELKTEDIEQGFERVGLVEGRIFNQATLDQVEREINDLYLSMGRYSSTVTTETESLENNRVSLSIIIKEGQVARIKKINLIGVEKEKISRVRKQMKLKDRRGLSPFTRKDQYSKQQFEADLESIRSYYLDRGYHDFTITSSSVEISSNKQNIFLSIAVEEGDVYRFGSTSIEGLEETQAESMLVDMPIEEGEPFSQATVSAARSLISGQLADDGYAFVDVIPSFTADEVNNLVDTLFTVRLNQRVYVRRIDISGNVFTRDEVIRRELRQFEGSWYSSGDISRSKSRLRRLGLFESVQIETPAVAGTTDQVDMKVIVKERDTGSILFSAGYSDADGALFGVELQQRNLFGTGKDLSLILNNSDAVDTYEIVYTNPYHTPDGISRGFRLLSRSVDSKEVNTAEYVLETKSGSVHYRIPIAETNSINLGFAYESITLESTIQTPPEFREIIAVQPESDQFVVTSGISRDNRDDFFFPTRGTNASLTLELAFPGSDFEYYKVNAQGSYFFPLGDTMALKGGLGLGLGGGYGDDANSELPFFKNYFAGGPKSVRGFESRSLGPQDTGLTPQPTGGDRRLLVNAELLFPAFGTGDARDKRFGLFTDGGMVWAASQDVELDDLRYSAGLYFDWYSPVGPLSISYGVPLDKEPGDEREKFQLSIGTVFR